MSININLNTPNKKGIANILKAIADDIAISSNDTVTVVLEVTFNKSKKEK